MTFKIKMLLISAFLVTVIGGGYYSFFYEKNKSPQIEYELLEVGLDDLTSTISTTGGVRPKNRLEVKPPIAGRIEALFVQEGDLVTRGQLIGELSSSDRVALIDAARASGEAELKRWEEIYRSTPIIGAIDGTIILRNVEPGQTITLADVIVTIADRLIVMAQVDETDVAKVKKNQNVVITLDAYPDSKIEGTVEHIAFEATTSESVTVYEVTINPHQVPDYMKSGMSVDVLFFTEIKENVVAIPSSAIQFDQDGAYVYMPGSSQSSPLRQSVRTGIQDQGKTEILTGLKAGDQILVPKIEFGKSQQGQQSTNPFMPQRPRGTRR